MGIDVTVNDNYTTLATATKTDVAAAVAAIRVAYAEAITQGDPKENVREILREVVTLQEES